MKVLFLLAFVSSALIPASVQYDGYQYRPSGCQYVDTTIKDKILLRNVLFAACAHQGQATDVSGAPWPVRFLFLTDFHARFDSNHQTFLEFGDRLARGLLDNRGQAGFNQKRMLCINDAPW